MSKIILLNKPFNVLSQFTDKENRANLSDYLADFAGFYPAGRLDYDSEGLLLLTDNGALQQRISAPKHKLMKTYYVQVEGEINQAAIMQLQRGLMLNDGKTLPAKAHIIQTPQLWPRTPPIRERKNQATSWLALSISEGRNRQVRRMTAAVGFPTLRLVRMQIGPWALGQLQPGQYRLETIHLPENTARSAKPR